MLWTIFVILLVLWLLALFSGHTVGGLVHGLLVIAIVVMLVRIFKGRKPV
jgi:chromate transport protein ChrA